MKGLSTALKVAMIAIVLLIVAIILLTIFGNALAPVVGLTEATNNCRTLGETTCRSAGTVPITWGIATMNTDQGMKSCQELAGCGTCVACNWAPS